MVFRVVCLVVLVTSANVLKAIHVRVPVPLKQFKASPRATKQGREGTWGRAELKHGVVA